MASRTPDIQHEDAPVREDNPDSNLISNQEVGDCVRNISPIFHALVPPVGRVSPEILSQYDKRNDEFACIAFSLRPNTITDIESLISFSTRVYQQWLRNGSLKYSGTAVPEVSYVEATGHFRLEHLRHGLSVNEFCVDKDSLQHTLRSLISVALDEAVKRHLTEGGDERLHLVPPAEAKASHTGVNKYYCPPHPVPSTTVVRGSCTCSPPSKLGFQAARECLRTLWDGISPAEDIFCDVRGRISALLGIKAPHHVILHPSGTDAEFTALLIALNQALSLGCSGVVSVVVGAKEVGSNTAVAASGRHFASHFPLEPTPAGTETKRVSGGEFPPAIIGGGDLRNGIKVIELAARLNDGSMVPNFDSLVLQTLDAATRCGAADGHQQPFFVVHSVDGSKLGSHITSRALVEQISSEYGANVLFVLDACQARTDAEELDWYLSHNAAVLITGSKFYGAPGFCGAVLVPDSAAKAGHLIASSDASKPMRCGTPDHNLDKYITQLEVPLELAALRKSLPRGPTNVGLLLRWSCGVAEMERFARTGQAGRRAIGRWVDRVRHSIRCRRPHLRLLRDTGCYDNEDVPFPAAPTFVGGVNSIVSFCVARSKTAEGRAGEVEGASLFGASGLQRIHKWLTKDISGRLPVAATAAERQTARLACHIGQPVDLGSCAVLRLAIGASLASDLAEGSRHLDDVLADDNRVLDKILLVEKYWGTLCSRDIG